MIIKILLVMWAWFLNKSSKKNIYYNCIPLFDIPQKVCWVGVVKRCMFIARAYANFNAWKSWVTPCPKILAQCLVRKTSRKQCFPRLFYFIIKVISPFIFLFPTLLRTSLGFPLINSSNLLVSSLAITISLLGIISDIKDNVFIIL